MIHERIKKKVLNAVLFESSEKKKNRSKTKYDFFIFSFRLIEDEIDSWCCYLFALRISSFQTQFNPKSTQIE